MGAEVMERFSQEYVTHVKKMREQFFATGSTEGLTNVRPEILELWQLAYEGGLQVTTADKPVLSPKKFSEAKNASKGLLRIAIPYMETLCGFLKEDSFWVTLADRNGVVLKLMGSKKALALASATNLFEGSFRDPNAKNYAGLLWACQHFARPFQIVATEHSTYVDDDMAGAASPILNKETGEQIGTICISGHWWESHTHTLGLVILTAEAIAQQIALDSREKMLVSAHKYLDMALEATDVGIVCFDRSGTIFAVNRSAMKMLAQRPSNKEDFIRRRVFYYLDGAVTEDNIGEVCRQLETEKEFSFDFTPKNRYSAVHSTLRLVSGALDTFIMQLQKQSDLIRMAADSAASRSAFTFDDIIGNSPQITSAKDLARMAAAYNSSVLIRGESGTGKELFAQAIHNASSRANKPFVAVNCGAIPKSLLESELFGYESGSFTGAQKGGKLGKFELANGGTLFLDEIGDMPYEAQVSLLRAIQTKSIVRVGGNKTIQIDIRLIAATHQNLEALIQNSTFREDLYYRLNVLSIQVPPLRTRSGDIGLLAHYFLGKYTRSFDKKVSKINADALTALTDYRWPGNVRELENVIERALIVSGSDMITLEDLPDAIVNGPALNGKIAAVPPGAKLDGEADLLRQLLRERKGNISLIARELGISRPTLYRKLKKLGLYEKLHDVDV